MTLDSQPGSESIQGQGPSSGTDLGDILRSVNSLSGHFTSQSLSSHAAAMRMKGNTCESHAAPDTVGLTVRFSLD